MGEPAAVQMPRLDEHGLPPAAAGLPKPLEEDQESDDEVDEDAKDQFYDDNLDEADEAWMRKAQACSGHQSDATLNCPCCFTTLCNDCQKHIRYHNQYRAMFTVNC